jgi:GntR family transcriptional regulator, transcriptional repressor for pyruvate dehydrogenase complex
VRTFEAVLGRLEAMIRAGELRPGDRLPNERLLAEELGVGRPSVREALRVLEALEVIEVTGGAGRASGSVVAARAGSALSSLLGLHLSLGHFGADELVEARLVLEIWSARTAAKQRSEEDVARLRSLLEQLEAAVGERDRYLELDTELHLAVASAAGNTLLSHLMEALRVPIVDLLHERTDARRDWDAVVDWAQPDHRALVDAIAAGDGDAAEDALRHHLSFYDER